MAHEGHGLHVFRSSADNSAVVSGQGWLDETTCGRLQSAIDEALDSGVERLRVDLLELDGIDDAGLRCLAATSERCRVSGIGLQIEASEPVRGLLTAGGLAEQYTA
jgi:anti-anti-sigma regulatory factor